jgi:hypothetical protein
MHEPRRGLKAALTHRLRSARPLIHGWTHAAATAKSQMTSELRLRVKASRISTVLVKYPRIQAFNV